jgi:hypothetical protein
MAIQEYTKEDQNRDNVLTQQFDTGTFLANLGRILKGFVYDFETKKYVTIKDEGYLNAIGARQVLNEIEGRVQNINSSANLRREEIAGVRKDIWFANCKKLFVNHKKFGLDAVNYRNVINLVDNNTLFFFSRSEDSGFFKGLKGFFQRKETVSQTHYMPEQTQQKKGFSL